MPVNERTIPLLCLSLTNQYSDRVVMLTLVMISEFWSLIDFLKCVQKCLIENIPYCEFDKIIANISQLIK